MRILVVDDDKDILYCYNLLLQTKGAEVYTTPDTQEALQIVKNKQINTAILDFVMPKLTGDKLAQKIHEIDENVKIYFVTGYNHAVEAIQESNIKVHGVFQKPVEPPIIENLANPINDTSEYHQNTITANLYSNI